MTDESNTPAPVHSTYSAHSGLPTWAWVVISAVGAIAIYVAGLGTAFGIGMIQHGLADGGPGRSAMQEFAPQSDQGFGPGGGERPDGDSSAPSDRGDGFRPGDGMGPNGPMTPQGPQLAPTPAS